MQWKIHHLELYLTRVPPKKNKSGENPVAASPEANSERNSSKSQPTIPSQSTSGRRSLLLIGPKVGYLVDEIRSDAIAIATH